MEPDSSELNQAIGLARSGQKDQAITFLRQILKQNPDHVRALLWLGGLTPDPSEGVSALKRALQLDPSNQAAQQGLAQLRTHLQNQPQPPTSGDLQPPCPSASAATPDTIPAEPERVITGEEMLRLASSVIWPFKDLKRPLGELLASGAVQSRDLGWATRKAYDPCVKWAAAVHLRARALQGVSLSPGRARQVVWHFKNLDRPTGELLDEQVITLHDLAWAVANAYNPQVRDAAAVLGAEIAQRILPSAAPADQQSPAAVAMDPPSQIDAPVIQKETRSASLAQPGPVVKPPAAGGRMRVVEGSHYLRDQEEHKARQRMSTAWTGILLVLTAAVLATWAILFLLVGFQPLFWCGLVAGGVLIGLAWLLVPRIERLQVEEGNYASGRRGEDKTAAALQECLDGQWTLFRNVLLPDGRGDIDAVLTGPKGIYALEVKTYSGYHRMESKRWQRRSSGSWKAPDRDPSRQAKQNATRLGNYLGRQGAEVWVEPRLVWAGDGKLGFKKPSIRIWQPAKPDFMLKDIGEGKAIQPDVLAKVNEILGAVRAASIVEK